jgi:hypothetical protein
LDLLRNKTKSATHQHDMNKSLVQGGVEVSKPEDAFPLAERLRQRSSKCESNVFNGVMVIDPRVTFCVHFNVQQAMGAYLLHATAVDAQLPLYISPVLATLLVADTPNSLSLAYVEPCVGRHLFHTMHAHHVSMQHEHAAQA